MTLQNGTLATAVANLTTADITLDTDGHDRSFKGLVTNYGEGEGATKREGGQVKFYPYKNGLEKVLAMLKGVTQSFEVI